MQKIIIKKAVAGSGKTKGLVDEYIKCLEETKKRYGEYQPERIVAFTYTKKAAAEIKKRVLEKLKTEKGEIWEKVKKKLLTSLRISTIHSFSNHILKWWINYGEKKFIKEIVEPEENVKLFDAAFEEALKNLKEDKEIEALAYTLVFLSKKDYTEIKKEILEKRKFLKISKYKRKWSYEQFAKIYKDIFEFYDDKNKKHLISLTKTALSPKILVDFILNKVFSIHERKKEEKKAIDFDDMILKVIESAGEKFIDFLYSFDLGVDYILLDEAQDTSPVEWKLLNILWKEFISGEGAKKETEKKDWEIYIVGDEYQSIYSSNLASPRTFNSKLNKLKEFVEKSNLLEEKNEFKNYRSTKKIIDFVNHYLKENKFKIKIEETEKGFTKEDSENSIVKNIYIEKTGKKEEFLEKCAEEILKEIYKLLKKDKNRNNLNILILTETNDSVEILTRNFVKYQIPVITLSGSIFFKIPEIQSLISLLKVWINPFDDFNLLKVLTSNFIFKELGEKDLNEIFEEIALWKLSNKDKNLLSFLEEKYKDIAENKILNYSRQIYEKRISFLLEKFLDEEEIWQKLAEDKQKVWIVKEFIKTIENKEKKLKNLAEFYSYLDLIEKDTPSKSMPFIGGKEKLTITTSTIHSAKGLEYDAVFVCIPPFKENLKGLKINFDDNDNVNILYSPSKQSTKKLSNEYSDFNKEIERILNDWQEEKKRLFYVAFTRAKTHLYILTPCPKNSKSFYNSFLEKLTNYFKNQENEKIDLDITKIAEEIKRRTSREEKTEINAYIEKKEYIDKVFKYTIKNVYEKAKMQDEMNYQKARFGEIIHSILQKISKETYRDITKEKFIEIAKKEFEKATDFQLTKEYQKEIEKIAENIFKNGKNSIWEKVIKYRKNTWSEFELIEQKEKEVISAKIDRIILENQILKIYDYKFYGDIETYKNKVKEQMKHYKELSNTFFKKRGMQFSKIKTFIVDLNRGKIEELKIEN